MVLMSCGLRVVCLLLPLLLAVTGFSSRILADWWLENLVVFLALLALALSHRRVEISNFSWALIFIFLCAHEYGALYSYSDAPLGEWMKPWLHSERNHYDRLVHFLWGLLITWPVMDAFRKGARIAEPSLSAIGVGFILATSAVYEIIEWLVASVVAPALGAEFIGAQGDPFIRRRTWRPHS